MFQDPSLPFYGTIAFKKEVELVCKGYSHDHNLPTLHTQYRIASVTKTFIGATYVKLCEQGLDLKTPVNQILKNFTHPQGHEITIEHLLCHQSGLGGFITEGLAEPFHEQYRSLDWLIEQTSQLPLEFNPGEKSIYSPPGYILLGAILEKYTQKPCKQLLEENFFTPLNLNQSTFDAAGTMAENRLQYRSLPQTYLWQDHKILPLEPLRNFSTSHGSGAVISTAYDLLQWIEALVIKQNVLSDSALSRMLHDYGHGFGYGICIGHSENHPTYYHFGSTSGISSILVACPNLKISVCILSHIQNYPMRVIIKEIWESITNQRLSLFS